MKDGEVIGFVEKPNTTKIGAQKVKVETKDRFGNRQVTEVPVEVTYGDSIVYQGVSNVTRSIVTLNHDEKKLHATFTNDTIHYRFVNEQYIGLTIYDGNGNEKTCNSRRARNFKEFCRTSKRYTIPVWRYDKSVSCRI